MCVCHLLLLTQQIQTTIFLCPCNMQDPSSPVRNWTHVPAGDMHSIYSHVWLFGLYSLWNSPSQNTGVGSLSLLQGIFPTQGLNPGLPHCRWILYQLSHQGSPRIQEWVAYPFSRGSSQPRNRTRISCIAGRSLPTELPGKHPPPPAGEVENTGPPGNSLDKFLKYSWYTIAFSFTCLHLNFDIVNDCLLHPKYFMCIIFNSMRKLGLYVIFCS